MNPPLPLPLLPQLLRPTLRHLHPLPIPHRQPFLIPLRKLLCPEHLQMAQSPLLLPFLPRPILLLFRLLPLRLLLLDEGVLVGFCGAEFAGDGADEGGLWVWAVFEVDAQVPEVGVTDAVAELEDLFREGAGGGEGGDVGLEGGEDGGVGGRFCFLRLLAVLGRFGDIFEALCGEVPGGSSGLPESVAHFGDGGEIWFRVVRNADA